MHRLLSIALLLICAGPLISSPQHTIPLQRLPDYTLLIPVRVNETGPFWCALDSGGSRVFALDSEVAAKAGLHLTRSGSSAGEGPAAVADQRLPGATLDLGSFRIPNRMVVIRPVGNDPSVCIFGTAILEQFVVEVDFLAPAVRLYRAESFQPSPQAVSVPVNFPMGNPVIPVQINLQPGPNIEAKLLVDTGVPLWPVALSKRFIDDNQILGRARQLAEPPFAGEGTGGSIPLLATRADRLAVGPFQTQAPVMRLFRIGSGTRLPWDGNLGAEFFRRFLLIIDYPNGRLFLEPNQNYGLPPAPYDGSGFWVRGASGHFLVERVLPGSLAARAGLQKGDLVLSLDGVAARDLTTSVIREKLYRSQGICTIRVQRAHERWTARLRLQRYL